jgi:hypothetical protein
MTARWLRYEHLCARYGDVSTRTIQRMVKDGRLPPPKFPVGRHLPLWREDELDEHDRMVTAKGRAAE